MNNGLYDLLNLCDNLLSKHNFEAIDNFRGDLSSKITVNLHLEIFFRDA